MFEKCKEKLFKLLAFIHLLRNQAVTFGKRKEQVVCMNFKILMLNKSDSCCCHFTGEPKFSLFLMNHPRVYISLR